MFKEEIDKPTTLNYAGPRQKDPRQDLLPAWSTSLATILVLAGVGAGLLLASVFLGWHGGILDRPIARAIAAIGGLMIIAAGWIGHVERNMP